MAFTFAIVACRSIWLRSAVSVFVLSSVASALSIIDGRRLLTFVISVLSCRVVTVRSDVILSTLCNELASAGSAVRAFRFANIESSLGSIFSTAGSICPTFPIRPASWFPFMVSPGASFSPEKGASTMLSFTFPSMSLSISALDPDGMFILLSMPSTATISLLSAP